MRDWHEETLAAYEREQDRLAELDAHVEREAPALAKRCLESAAWCEAAMGEDELINAQNAVGLLMAEPEEYGRRVKRAMEDYALKCAGEFLKQNPGDTDTPVMELCSYTSNGQLVSYWRRVV